MGTVRPSNEQAMKILAQRTKQKMKKRKRKEKTKLKEFLLWNFYNYLCQIQRAIPFPTFVRLPYGTIRLGSIRWLTDKTSKRAANEAKRYIEGERDSEWPEVVKTIIVFEIANPSQLALCWKWFSNVQWKLKTNGKKHANRDHVHYTKRYTPNDVYVWKTKRKQLRIWNVYVFVCVRAGALRFFNALIVKLCIKQDNSMLYTGHCQRARETTKRTRNSK